MDEGRTGVPEQLAETFTKDKAEPSHAVEIDDVPEQLAGTYTNGEAESSHAIEIDDVPEQLAGTSTNDDSSKSSHAVEVDDVPKQLAGTSTNDDASKSSHAVEIDYVPEQLAGASTNDDAESSHAVEIDDVPEQLVIDDVPEQLARTSANDEAESSHAVEIDDVPEQLVIDDVPEQLAGTSANDEAEPSNAVEIDDVPEQLAIDDVPKQLAGTSANGEVESRHAAEIDDVPKQLAGTSTNESTRVGEIDSHRSRYRTTLNHWLDHSLRQRDFPSVPIGGEIHMVPNLLRAKIKPGCNYYEPNVVSIGPYHYDNPKLKKFQDLKSSMAGRLMPNKQLEVDMRSEIRKNIDSLMNAYSSEKMKMAEHIVWEEMFFLDGCFVLHFIYCTLCNRVGDLNIERSEIDLVRSDLLLTENQLPFKLLKILSGNDSNLLYHIDNYIYTHEISNHIDWYGGRDVPVHLMDRLRIIITGGLYKQRWPRKGGVLRGILFNLVLPESLKPDPSGTKMGLRHAKELTARRIHLKPNRTGFLKDISFGSYGTLRLPRIIVDDSTSLFFMNMAAYEICRSDLYDKTITSYLYFLGSLINHTDDIKELQSAGVLANHLATDEEAVDLFNEMSQGLSLDPVEDVYKEVKWKIQSFLEHKTRASIAFWVVEGYHNHFESPLTAMAFFAACLALGLGATQTYFTVYPSGNK